VAGDNRLELLALEGNGLRRLALSPGG
jgi:hypothetical protein